MNIQPPSPRKAAAQSDHLSSADILHRATKLAPELAAAVDECETLGHLPPRIMAALRQAGVFRIAFPTSMGGPEMSLADQVRLIATLSEANPSVAWNVMILADSGYFAGRLNPAAARTIWPDLDMATSAVRNPAGRAERVDGGYRLTGRFAFVSGIHNADRVSLPCYLYDGDEVALGVDGQPELHVAFPSIKDVVVHDSWDTIGLRGTGSNQISIENAFVADGHVIPNSDAPMFSAAPLSRYVNLMYVNQLGVILGATRALILAVQKRIASKFTPDRQPLKNHYRTRIEVPRAWGLYQAACSYVYETAAAADAKIFADEPLPQELLAQVVAMSVIAPQLCREAVDGALDIVATDQIFRSTGIDKLYSDLRVAMTHVVHRRDWLSKASPWLDAPPN